MKKIFSKLENKNDEKAASNFVTNYTGKVFTINKHSVVVEEILAEGAECENKAIKTWLLQFRLLMRFFFLLSYQTRRICDSVSGEGH